MDSQLTMLGYRFFSFPRASPIWHCRSTPRCLAFAGLAPSGQFGSALIEFADAAALQALSRLGTQLVLGDVEPTAVLGREDECPAPHVGPSFLGLQGFVERAFRVGVEMVAYQGDFAGASISRIKETRDLTGPIDFGSTLAGADFAPTGERFAEHEDARRAGPLLFVVHASRMSLGRCNRRSGLRPSHLLRRTLELLDHPDQRFALAQPQGAVMGTLQHARRRFLHLGFEASTSPSPARDIQHRSRRPVHEPGVHRSAASVADRDQHGWPRTGARQRVRGAPVANGEVRGYAMERR